MENQDMIDFVQAISNYIPQVYVSKMNNLDKIALQYVLEDFLKEMKPKIREMKINSLL